MPSRKDIEEIKKVKDLEKEIGLYISFLESKKNSIKNKFRDSEKRKNGSLSGEMYNYHQVEKKIQSLYSIQYLLERMKKINYV